MIPVRRALLALWPVIALAGCSVPALFDRVSYEDSSREVVELACGERFEVVDNRTASRVKVASGVVGELGASVLGRDCADPQLAKLHKSERFQKAARTYLDRTDRKECRFGESRVLSVSQFEFRYECGPEEKSKRGRPS